MKQSALKTALFIALLPIATHIHANGIDEIVVSKTGVNSVGQVAIVPFLGDTAGSSNTIARLLDSTELTASNQKLPHNPQSAREVLDNINAWRNQGFAHVVIGKSHSIVGNKIAISYEIIDLAQGTLIGTPRTQISDNNPAALSHASKQIGNHIYQSITGNFADFDGQIAYIEESVSKPKISTLKITDPTGQNTRTLFSVQGSILSPAFSKDGSQIAFSVQKDNALPVIYAQSVNGGEPKLLTPFWGHNLSASFSPDGSHLLFSGSHDNNNPNIYYLDLINKQLKQLTDLQGAENAPRALVDGTGFIFTADHGSRSQSLYRQSFNSKNSVKIANNASNPQLNTAGDKVVYANADGITVVNLSGAVLHRIGVTGTEISPSFSPSSNKIIYSVKQGNQSKLIIYSLANKTSQTLNTTGIVRDPVWSK